MKKIINFLIALLATFSATAVNYFTIDGVASDTLRIHPLYVSSGKMLTIGAHFGARLDFWHLDITYPNGLSYGNYYEEGEDLDVPYKNRWGEDSICHADFVMLLSGTAFMASLTTKGYYDPDGDGNYDTYGTVKWEAGDYPELFKIRLCIDNTFHCDTLRIHSLLSSTHDWRGETVGPGVDVYQNIIIHVGYQRGDVNGDGLVNISDVTALNHYLLLQDGLDQYQLEAADMNCDGNVTINDVTTLINILLQNGQINETDLESDM